MDPLGGLGRGFWAVLGGTGVPPFEQRVAAGTAAGYSGSTGFRTCLRLARGYIGVRLDNGK